MSSVYFALTSSLLHELGSYLEAQLVWPGRSHKGVQKRRSAEMSARQASQQMYTHRPQRALTPGALLPEIESKDLAPECRGGVGWGVACL